MTIENNEYLGQTPAEKVAEINAQINKDIAEEVERRVTEWLQKTHGVDFAARLNVTTQLNNVLKAQNRKFVDLIREAYTFTKCLDVVGCEHPLNYKLRAVVEAVARAQERKDKKRSAIEVVR